MPPKKLAPLDDLVCNEIAETLGVTVPWRTLKASSENMSNKEKEEAQKERDRMYEEALAGGAGEELANEEADLSHKKATFQYKLAKAWAKHQKKAGVKADERPQPPPEVHEPAAIQVVEIGDSVQNAKRTEYQEEIQKAYDRVLGHRVFKGVCGLDANDITADETRDCGIQASMLFNLIQF